MSTRGSDLPWQRAIVLLTGTLIGIAVVAALYWIQVIFIPFTIAVLLTFILGPFVRLLQKHGLPRGPAVILVMMVATSLLAGIGWLIGHQMTELVQDLPNYEANIKRKIDLVKGLGAGTGRLEHLFEELSQQWKGTPEALPPSSSEQSLPTEVPEQTSAPKPVNPWGPSWPTLTQYFGTAIAFLGGLVFVFVLTIFMLFNREDLRSRFLRLAGRDHLTLTTKAVDEAFHRISRYLMMQVLLNSCYGFVFAVGLAMIGIQHAVLWGVMAALMRYVPYVGAWIVGALALLLSVAISADWLRPIMLLCLFVALEVLFSNFVEPWFYGKSIGVSQVALLVAAAFWAFLWGPIGLVLAGPMTVCLVVLGKYVPRLKFIDVLLGDEPALAPDVHFYQRLLARDREEAVEMVVKQAESSSLEQVYDTLLTPALTYAKRDRDRDELTDEEVEFILQVIREIVEKLDQNDKLRTTTEMAPSAMAKVRIVVCASQDDEDALAMDMFRRLLDPTLWEIENLSPNVLASEIVAIIKDKRPAFICIASLPPGGLAHARYLCKRLKAQVPDLKILVGRWGLKNDIEQNREELKNAGADDMETNLIDTRDWLKYRQSIGATEPIANPKSKPKDALATVG